MRTNPSDELVDVVDELNKCVRVVTRAQMRAEQLPHRCTYILVFNRAGQLFIHQRTPCKDVYPSYWDVTVGGVLGAGETYDTGARREAREELGIEAPDIELLFPFRYTDARTTVHGMVYRIIHDGPFQLQPEEIVRGEFVSVDSIAERSAQTPFCPDGLAVFDTYREFLERVPAQTQRELS